LQYNEIVILTIFLAFEMAVWTKKRKYLAWYKKK